MCVCVCVCVCVMTVSSYQKRVVFATETTPQTF